jgi:hypothetical protein
VQEGEVTVRAIALTFEAGVDYRFAADGFLDIGWNNNAAELQVEGTEADPVVFQGLMPTEGYYRGLNVGAQVLSSSTIANMEVKHGGGLDTYALALRAQIHVDGLTLEDNTKGLHIAGPLQPGGQNLSVTGTNGVPVTIHPTALTSLPEGGSFVGNDDDEILIDGSATQLVTGTIPDLGVPYHLIGDLSLRDGSNVTIAAGTEFVMGGGAQLEIGWNNGTATLVAVGTSAEPIVFVGEQDTPGYWGGVLIGQNVTATSEIDYVTIVNGGTTGNGGLMLRRAISVTNSTIRGSTGACIEKQAADGSDYTDSNDLSDCTQGDVVDN